ncbi:hypothetical protein STEG23_033520, partial [Scotinomys teguina]
MPVNCDSSPAHHEVDGQLAPEFALEHLEGREAAQSLTEWEFGRINKKMSMCLSWWHTFNPDTQEIEAGRSRVQDQPGLQRIYLLDLIYIDSAYPASGSIMENEQRSNQMNNILRIIADLQVSCSYDHLTTLPHVQKYLKSVRYIEELQKFVEDDNYKLSLRIEPGSSSPRLVSSKEDLAGPSAGSSSARFRRRPTCPDTSVAGSLPTPPVPRHRKSHSLGNNMMCQLSVVESKSATFPSEKARHLLDDSVLESRSPRRGPTLTSSTAFTNGLSLGSSESSEFSEEMSAGLE